MPGGATDTHIHLFGPQSKYRYVEGREYTPPDATPEAARHLFRTMKIDRAVVIQPSVYGMDNSAQLELAQRIGIPTRAVVVVPYETPDRELSRLYGLGARGLRYTIAHPGALEISNLERHAERMKEVGWHIQFLMKAHQLLELEERLARLPTTIVIDHIGYLRASEGLQQPVFQALLRLLKLAHVWVKLSGVYRLSVAPPYADLAPYVNAVVETAPDRVVWASDWPHASIRGVMKSPSGGDWVPPNTTDILDALAGWVPDADLRKRILVDNPARLYGF
jgi:predicted TIM-barrel fold metal-dependent hydrolase